MLVLRVHRAFDGIWNSTPSIDQLVVRTPMRGVTVPRRQSGQDLTSRSQRSLDLLEQPRVRLWLKAVQLDSQGRAEQVASQSEHMTYFHASFTYWLVYGSLLTVGSFYDRRGP